jgi:hypothetical protein
MRQCLWGETFPGGWVHESWEPRSGGYQEAWPQPYIRRFYRQCAGFGVDYFDGKPGPYSVNLLVLGVEVPYWFIAGTSLLMPMRWLWRWSMRRRSAAAGLCQRCGYDLRASPDRCPECGAAAVRSRPANPPSA